MTRDRQYASLAVILTAASVLLTVPVLEMGLNDDWSYTWIARRLAQSGHLTYDGWVTPIIGAQAFWAALLIRLFGFSFTLVRLSTLPFALGCAYLLYRLARFAGLRPAFAFFATLLVVLSPVFIPLSASFMTDVPGFFFWLASIYCAARAIEAEERGRAITWLAAAAIAGFLGGTIRQAIWVVPALVIPLAAWRRRRDRGFLISAAVIWCVTMLAAKLLFSWFQAQPYSQPTQSDEAAGLLAGLDAFLRFALACLLLLLPALALYTSAWRKALCGRLALLLGLVIPGLLFAAVMGLFHHRLLLGNLVSPQGILYHDTVGTRPFVLGPAVLDTLSIILFVIAGCALAVVLGLVPQLRAENYRQLSLFCLLYLPVAAVYLAAIVFRAMNDGILIDRYAIPLLPLLAIPLLAVFQNEIGAPVSALGWLSLTVFALFGIANAHDYLSSARARLKAASALTATGIPRTEITAGVEYDGWTQLLQAGYINAPDILNPPNAWHSQDDRVWPISPPYWFWDKTPAIDPRYFISHSALAGTVDSRFPPVRYRTWLPPYHRRFLTEELAPSTSVSSLHSVGRN